MPVRKKGNFFDTKLIPFLKKYGLFLLAFIVAFPYLLRFIRNQVQKTKEQTADLAVAQNNSENNQSSPIIIQVKTSDLEKKYPNASKSKHAEISAGALKIAMALGTNVDDNHQLFGGVIEFFNVSAMVEDEKTVVKELKKYPGTFPILEEYYYSVHTKSKNLKTDLLKYLEPEQLAEVRKAWKKFGNYKWI